jgi:ribosomal protein L3 glutamine methyltransferase
MTPTMAQNHSPFDDHALIDDLVTLRDWLRFAVSAFTKAGLVFGHGTSRAVDEAAFLLLSTLNLPHDELEPWLDCRLSRTERVEILSILVRRIETRLPAPYLTRCAYIGPYRFYCDERVIVPRSFIGELLNRDGLFATIADPESVARVLDLCTGSGCLAILAAHAFPSATVDACDLSAGALDVARRNVADYHLEERIKLYQGDLFGAVGDNSYDLIISNPPYVTVSSAAAFPPEYKAEPRMAHVGGADGLDIVRRILDQAPEHLTDDGVLVVEIGEARAALEATYPHVPFLWLDTDESEGEVFAVNRSELVARPRAKKASAARKGH